MRPTLEGGDVLVLREDLLAIGYSERTEKTTIERLAESFKKLKSPIKRLLVVAIPPERSFMHLDTVFTMISQDECLVYGPMILPDGAEEADVYECDLTKREITWTTEKDLLSALKAQKLDLRPIRCGGQDPIAERREQWTDGANAFALAPGVVLMYDRNEATAAELARCGYTVVDEADLLMGREELELWKPARKYVIQLAAHELSRARGGPRCMTMPLVREDVAPPR
ncbi:MAG TPA: arginine deiminase family protein, partial [Thermoanaerobaculia bacterium]|nr:arginine deiminase family protein [Thermoanaerobaculia bacterium]